jgi:hypothetical protein
MTQGTRIEIPFLKPRQQKTWMDKQMVFSPLAGNTAHQELDGSGVNYNKITSHASQTVLSGRLEVKLVFALLIFK